jgi:hypothetical protein
MRTNVSKIWNACIKAKSTIITLHKNQHRMIDDDDEEEEEDGSDVNDLTERKFYLIFM